MKKLCIVAVLLSASLSVHAQGTFIYDQQSADENHYQDGGVTFGAEPGQSFTPSFDSIGFIRIYIYGGGGSGTFSVTLRSDSITGIEHDLAFTLLDLVQVLEQFLHRYIQ